MSRPPPEDFSEQPTTRIEESGPRGPGRADGPTRARPTSSASKIEWSRARATVGDGRGSEWRLVIGSASDRGRARARNEDAIHVEPVRAADVQVWGWFGAVADGLGGRPAGDVASRLAVQTARDTFYWEGPGDIGERLLAAVERANGALYRAARRTPERAGMASTITAAVIRGTTLYVAQVGDSRAYLVRDGRIQRLTQDHSWVEDSVRAGLLTPKQARDHPRRNLITRVLGDQEEIVVDLIQGELGPGDVIILCSDGLHGLVEDAEMADLIGDDPQEAVDRLVALANERGGTDNISVIVARLTPNRVAESVVAPATPSVRIPLATFFGIAALTAILTFWALWLLQDPILRAIRPGDARPTASPVAAPTVILAAPTLLPAPVIVPIPTPSAASPQAGGVLIAPPTASPATTSAVGSAVAGASPPAALAGGRVIARFREGGTVRIRSAPRLTPTSVLVELPPPDPRRRDPVELRGIGRGDAPTDPELAPADQTDLWYEVAWPGFPPDQRAYIHCSTVELDAAPNGSCDPPPAMLPSSP